MLLYHVFIDPVCDLQLSLQHSSLGAHHMAVFGIRNGAVSSMNEACVGGNHSYDLVVIAGSLG